LSNTGWITETESWSSKAKLNQCLKCLTLVKSSETPYLLQQSMASWSLILPPGSAITPIPLSHASSTASFQAVHRLRCIHVNIIIKRKKQLIL